MSPQHSGVCGAARARPTGLAVVPAGTRRRVALYSHDTQGLGHVRRNLAIAAALVAAEPATDVLVLTGAPEAATLPLPPGTDIVTLPTLSKDSHGRYAARRMAVPLAQLTSLRSALLQAALVGFAPDLLLVDKVARGVHGELDGALAALAPTDTRVVLGLREVLDDPATTRREWDVQATTATLEESYDAVWVYGDPAVYDLGAEADLPSGVRDRMQYTGYLARGRGAGAVPRVRVTDRVAVPTLPYVLCLVGGGQDGRELAETFVLADLPAGHRGLVVTGPYMRADTRSALHALVDARPGLELVEYVPDIERFIDGASAVVAMAGYNTVCELLAAGRPALLVPRLRPRAEQLLRARSLARLGLVDTMHPDGATPAAVGEWLADAVRRPAAPPTGAVDLDGLAGVCRLTETLLARSNAPAVLASGGPAHVAV